MHTTSSTRIVTIQNIGNATLSIRSVALVGTDSSQFSKNNYCSTVSARASCTVEVKSSPTSPRPIADSISVEHNATGSPVEVSLGCDGVAPPNPGSTQILSIGCAPYGGSKLSSAKCAVKPMAGDKIRIAFKNTGTNVLTSSSLPLLSGPASTCFFLNSYPRYTALGSTASIDLQIVSTYVVYLPSSVGVVQCGAKPPTLLDFTVSWPWVRGSTQFPLNQTVIVGQ